MVSSAEALACKSLGINTWIVARLGTWWHGRGKSLASGWTRTCRPRHKYLAQHYLKTEIIVVPSRGVKPTVGVYSHTNLGTHPTSPSVVVLSVTGAASTQEPARSGFQKRPCVGYGIPAGLLCSGVTCCPRIEPASPDSVFGVGDSGVKTIILCPRRRDQAANQALITDC